MGFEATRRRIKSDDGGYSCLFAGILAGDYLSVLIAALFLLSVFIALWCNFLNAHYFCSNVIPLCSGLLQCFHSQTCVLHMRNLFPLLYNGWYSGECCHRVSWIDCLELQNCLHKTWYIFLCVIQFQWIYIVKESDYHQEGRKAFSHHFLGFIT